MAGLLTGLPALCANGLLSGVDKHLSLPKGFYSALHILLLLGFMALGRIRRPEGLRAQWHRHHHRADWRKLGRHRLHRWCGHHQQWRHAECGHHHHDGKTWLPAT
ncbi:MAG: putative transposase [Rhodoferax sp.]